jgi:hypothetical protein
MQNSSKILSWGTGHHWMCGPAFPTHTDFGFYLEIRPSSFMRRRGKREEGKVLVP